MNQDLAVSILDMQIKYALERGIDIRNRTVQLLGEIDTLAFAHIDSALTLFEQEGKSQITIKINSMGGSVYDALAIVARIKKSNCYIVTEGYGMVMSAATAVLAAGKKRRMSELTSFMVHEGSYFVEGKHSEVSHIVRQMEREEKAWAQLMAKLTNEDVDYWLQLQKAGRDIYLSAQECKKLGIIDEVF